MALTIHAHIHIGRKCVHVMYALGQPRISINLRRVRGPGSAMFTYFGHGRLLSNVDLCTKMYAHIFL